MPASANLAHGLIDQTHRGNPMAALVGIRDLQFVPCGLQRAQRVDHVWLRRDGETTRKAGDGNGSRNCNTSQAMPVEPCVFISAL
jgi:hypothetical protein